MKTHMWTLGFALSLTPVALAQVSEGDQAPAIEISEPLETGIKKWRDLKGKVLLIDFFGTF